MTGKPGSTSVCLSSFYPNDFNMVYLPISEQETAVTLEPLLLLISSGQRRLPKEYAIRWDPESADHQSVLWPLLYQKRVIPFGITRF